MQKSEDYQPISCDYVDYIEHLATLKQEVVINYMDNLKIRTSFKDVLLTWKNEEDGEYLYTKNRLKIRLDYIVSIEGKNPNDISCGT